MTLPVRQASVNLDDSEGFCSRVLTKLNSVWVSVTFSFSCKPRNLSLHYASDVSRRLARHIRLGSRVEIGKHTWLSTGSEDNQKIQLTIEDDCRIGARCTISAKNSIHLERDVILASDVLIIDNNHAYEDVATPIARQGTTPGGTIRIGEGCRIGAGVAVICEKGELVLGNNSIVAPRSVVTRSFPPHSVLSGNPARIVRGLDAAQPISLSDTLSSTNVEGGVRKKIAAEPCSTNSETAVASRQIDIDEAAKNRGLISRAWQTISQQDLRGIGFATVQQTAHVMDGAHLSFFFDWQRSLGALLLASGPILGTIHQHRRTSWFRSRCPAGGVRSSGYEITDPHHGGR